MNSSGWFGVRCVFAVGESERAGLNMYEERVTIWRAPTIEEAIHLAEAEAMQYARDIDSVFTGLAQAYLMADDVASGAEVFSLIRASALGASDYVSAFFDTGEEYQQDLAAGDPS